MSNDETTRRDIIRALAGTAAFGTMSPSIRLAIAAEGASLPVNVVTANASMANTLLGIAKEKRFLEDLGLKPVFTETVDGSKALPAVVSGEVDLGTMQGIGLVFPAIARGGPLKIIGSGSNLLQLAVYSANSDVKSLKDLAGRTVGTGALGAMAHQIMVAVLQKKGVDVSKVQFRNVGNVTDIFKAVVAGTVDAGPSSLDVYDQQAKFGTHVLSDGNFWTELPEYIHQGTFTSDRAIGEKRETLVRVLAGFAKLCRFIQTPESKDSFVKNYREASGDKDDAQALSAWNFVQRAKPYSTDIVIGEDKIQYMQKLNVEMNIQPSVLPFDKIADMSLAREALKLI